ncbi:MAG TPA: FtsW/RodA/SpoVE family cell cycle protein [Chitinophagaceae bacterium]|nr:FtsW/RodA/SpoVE family cell cycle protein [Chitinophagaceae bacterium]
MERFLQKTKGDKVIWSVVVILSLVSVLAVYSSTGTLAYRMRHGNTEYYLVKQLSVLILGILIIYFAHRVNYTVYSRVAVFGFLVAIPLLVYTYFFGSHINDASRWIRLPVINLTFQTSDMAKLALFMYMARQLSKKQDVIKDLKKGYLPLIIPVVIICALIAPANLSTALLLGASCLMLCFIGRVRMKHILMTILVAAIPLVFLVGAAMVTYHGQETGVDPSQDNNTLIVRAESHGRVGTWIRRVQDFMYSQHSEAPYQVQQAKIAIAGGGLFGRGPGNSEERNFLPHPYSDFIYAIIIEEYGLVGGALLIAFYLIFLFRSIRIFKRCPYAFGAFLAVGLSFTLVIQALANMAVTVNIFPVTGVTLPLVSMGGSSIWFTSLAIGIILSVARNVEDMEGSGTIRMDQPAFAGLTSNLDGND